MRLEDAKRLLRQAEDYVKGANQEIQSIVPPNMVVDDWQIMCKPCYEYKLKHAKDILELLLEETT